MTALHPPRDTTWATYLQRFHTERPGITERILSRCRADRLDPYQWCAQPLGGQPGPILDLACDAVTLSTHARYTSGLLLGEVVATFGADRRAARRRTNEVTGRATADPQPRAIAIGRDAVWIASQSGRLTRVMLDRSSR